MSRKMDGKKKMKKVKKDKEKIQFSVSSIPEGFFELSDEEQHEWAKTYLKRIMAEAKEKSGGPSGD